MTVHFEGAGGKKEIDEHFWDMLKRLVGFKGVKQELTEKEAVKLAEAIDVWLDRPIDEIKDYDLHHYIGNFGTEKLKDVVAFCRKGGFQIWRK